jgi:ubiquinone/menaquinone biosynthesis C-methylase UbiE
VAAEFADVTELAGTEISAEQLQRMSHRYHWAAQLSRGKDVVEVACGSGQGLGILAAVARSLEGGDLSEQILEIASRHYGNRIRLAQFDAQILPYADRTKDVILLFEAIYYIPDATRFVSECRRVLRPGGQVLVVTANKDLADFNPSPLSHRYYGAVDLVRLFHEAGFDVELYGYLPVTAVSLRQRMLRPLKKAAVALGVMPKTMGGKRLLKRLVFGSLVAMPAELPQESRVYTPPVALSASEPDRTHKVIYCRATLRG